MPYTVYTLTNTDDTHIYIGCTKDYERRRYIHMYACKRGDHKNHHLQALYNQLGPDCFEFDAVEEHATKAEAVKAEQRWVDYYLAAPEWQLLNIATDNVDAPMCNAEVAAKVAIAQRGKVIPAATKAKISASMKGVNAKPIYVKWSDGTEAEFASTTEAARLLGVAKGLVSMWCNGSSKSYTKPKYGIAEIRFL